MVSSRFVSAAAAAIVSTGALAQTSASGTISLIGTNGSDNEYDIQLTNTGTTGIETFWFAWVPGMNFMPDEPSSISQPTGWTDTVTGSTDGYAIQWKTSGGLAAGHSLDGFMFSSVDSLSTLEGMNQGHPILTSYVYSGQPFSGTSDQFVVSPTPEPASWLAITGLAGCAAIVRRRRAARADV